MCTCPPPVAVTTAGYVPAVTVLATVKVIASETPAPTVGAVVAALHVIPVGAVHVIATVPAYELIGETVTVPVPVFPIATGTSCVVVVREKSDPFSVIVNGAEDCAE